MDAVGAAAAETEGISLLPLLRAPDSAGPERDVFWEHIGNDAVRRGDWKLVREWDGPWELCNIRVDRTESHDLAASEPELVAELTDSYYAWAESHGVIPWENVLDDHESRGILISLAVG